MELVEPKSMPPTTGSAGLRTQAKGCVASVSSLSHSTGGIERGSFVETDT